MILVTRVRPVPVWSGWLAGLSGSSAAGSAPSGCPGWLSGSSPVDSYSGRSEWPSNLSGPGSSGIVALLPCLAVAGFSGACLSGVSPVVWTCSAPSGSSAAGCSSGSSGVGRSGPLVSHLVAADASSSDVPALPSLYVGSLAAWTLVLSSVVV